MTGTVVLILIGFVGGIILLSVVTQVLEGTSREWKELAGRYPPQPPAPDAATGEARIRMGRGPEQFRSAGCFWFFMPWTWTRGVRQVRYAVDDDSLHLETEGGRFAPRSAMSVPWAEIDVEREVATHMGDHALLRVGDVAIAFPSELVRRELEVRAQLANDEPHPGAQDGPIEWEEDL